MLLLMYWILFIICLKVEKDMFKWRQVAEVYVRARGKVVSKQKYF